MQDKSSLHLSEIILVSYFVSLINKIFYVSVIERTALKKLTQLDKYSQRQYLVIYCSRLCVSRPCTPKPLYCLSALTVLIPFF